jgi:hypothetical protein
MPGPKGGRKWETLMKRVVARDGRQLEKLQDPVQFSSH